MSLMSIVGANPHTAVLRDVNKDIHTEGVAALKEPTEQGNIFNFIILMSLQLVPETLWPDCGTSSQTTSLICGFI